MTVGTATSANALAAGSYENIRAGTATIALTLSTNANGTYPNMTVGTATSANALAAGSYENIRAGTATLALSITTTTISIGSYVNLPGLTTVYDSTAACQGLGFAEIDFAGVKQIIFSVYGYKGYDNPNNDLIWELYRDDGTPGSLMTASDTANTAGTRYVQSVLTSGIPTGAARVRIRARYQNSDADAAFLGASLKLVR
jgi:hypothetical protein